VWWKRCLLYHRERERRDFFLVDKNFSKRLSLYLYFFKSFSSSIALSPSITESFSRKFSNCYKRKKDFIYCLLCSFTKKKGNLSGVRL
jgi:hypothetical protein